MSRVADIPPEVLPGRPNLDTHDRMGSTWVPKEDKQLPSSDELASKGQYAEPLIDAKDFLTRLDADSKHALGKVVDPASTADQRSFYAGVLYMSGRAQHRIIFKVEPPDEGKGDVNEA